MSILKKTIAGALTIALSVGAIGTSAMPIFAASEGNIDILRKNVEKAHTNIMKVEHIIEEFQATLDHKYAIAEDFDNVYKYLQERLAEANMKKDKEILEEILTHLRTMRDTWKEVMRLNKLARAN